MLTIRIPNPGNYPPDSPIYRADTGVDAAKRLALFCAGWLVGGELIAKEDGDCLRAEINARFRSQP